MYSWPNGWKKLAETFFRELYSYSGGKKLIFFSNFEKIIENSKSFKIPQAIIWETD